MSRRIHLRATTLVIASMLLVGCHPTQPFYFHEDGDLSHYVGMATDIEYPDVDVQSLDEVEYARDPLTLDNADFENVWEISLDAAVQLALANSKVIRSLGGRITGASDVLLSNPDFANSVYNPALQESSPGLGTGFAIGPEAALAAFDADFNASVFWQKNDRANNFTGGGAVGFVPQTFQRQDLGTFQADLTKTAATGATFAFRNTTNYEWNNNLTVRNAQFGKIFASEWRTEFEAEIRQPFLQGAGVLYNRIAGPFSPFAGVGTRQFDGVVLARINTDKNLADFEAAVRNLVGEVEQAYWELYFAYRNLEAGKVGMTSSLRTWQTVQSITVAGARGGGPERESLAREQYYNFRSVVERAKSDLFEREARLRFLMGLASSDGRLARPSDEPTTAKVTLQYGDVVGEGLIRSVELRKQKWQIQQRELELVAAQNHLLPRLDGVGRYRWNGLGDDLISQNRGAFNSAFGTLMDGNFEEWELGLQFTLPIGFRQELAAVRHQQLLLAKDRQVLREQEFELSHQLADDMRQMALQFQLIETNFNRRVAALTQVETFQAKVDVGVGSAIEQLDLLLDAQRRLADAESQYFRAVVDYNQRIALLNLHKGSLLENHNVFLAEGPWPGKAYFDAIRVARQRDASMFLDYGFTRPGEFSRGPYTQQMQGQQGRPTPIQTQEGPELLPTPTPEVPEEELPEATETLLQATAPSDAGPSLIRPTSSFEFADEPSENSADFTPIGTSRSPKFLR